MSSAATWTVTRRVARQRRAGTTSIPTGAVKMTCTGPMSDMLNDVTSDDWPALTSSVKPVAEKGVIRSCSARSIDAESATGHLRRSPSLSVRSVLGPVQAAGRGLPRDRGAARALARVLDIGLGHERRSRYGDGADGSRRDARRPARAGRRGRSQHQSARRHGLHIQRDLLCVRARVDSGAHDRDTLSCAG